MSNFPDTPAPASRSERWTQMAKADLAARLSIPIDKVEVVEQQSVTWRDSSLGCPQPGMQYMQVLVEGMRLRLRANGQTYDYHSGGNRPPFLCENASKPLPTDPPPGLGDT